MCFFLLSAVLPFTRSSKRCFYTTRSYSVEAELRPALHLSSCLRLRVLLSVCLFLTPVPLCAFVSLSILGCRDRCSECKFVDFFRSQLLCGVVCLSMLARTSCVFRYSTCEFLGKNGLKEQGTGLPMLLLLLLLLLLFLLSPYSYCLRIMHAILQLILCACY